MQDAIEIATVTKETVDSLASGVNEPESEAIFISCIALHTIEVIDKLEYDLKKPVISSNQATMWHLLRLANVNDNIERYGQLLSKY